MKQLAKVVAVVAFVLATSLFLLLLSVRLSGFSAFYLKTKLTEGDIYTKAVADLNKSLEVPIGGITAGYVKGKTEKLIDDTEAWVKGDSETPPSLSFTDLNPQGFAEIKKLAVELKAQQEQIKKTGQSTEFSQFDVDKFIKNDFSISLGEQLAFVKQLYRQVLYGLPILGLILATSIAGLLLLSETREEKFHWLGTALLVSAFWNILPWAGVFFGFKALEGVVSDKSSEAPAVIEPLFRNLVSPVVAKYIQVAALALAILFIAAIVSFVSAKGRRQQH